MTPVAVDGGSGGGAVRVTVYAPIWLVNKTGLPLVFRQEGYTIEAAGQDVENEVARMGAPLMFSFMEREGNQSVTMRIGTGLHQGEKLVGVEFSSKFC